MPGYVITSVFEVGGGKVPLGADVLAAPWGMGHRFSYCDGRMLTLVVQLTAIDVSSAFEALLSRAEMIWQGLGHEPLGPPVTLRVQGAVEPTPVPAGIPPLQDDGGALPENPASALARGRDKALRTLRLRRLRQGMPEPVVLHDLIGGWDWEDPPDDGGLAGVREPRRPRPGPPGLHLARDLPTGVDEAAAS